MLYTKLRVWRILKISNLSVKFPRDDGQSVAVDRVSLSIEAGSVVGVLGESGSGKSQLFRSICGLTPGEVSGAAMFEGVDLLSLDAEALSDVRGRKIGYIFQDPMTSLNPFLRVRTQMIEVAQRHLQLSAKLAEKRAIELLDLVRIPDPRRVLKNFPHELSGGMRQRVVIAMALMAKPKLLIADEPTTALDATVQLEILRLLKSLAEKTGVAIVLISHDIGVVASVCDEVAVMYAGRIVERAETAGLIRTPRHPYTSRLIESTPDIGNAKDKKISGIAGTLPQPGSDRDRCLFADRCLIQQPKCFDEIPELRGGVAGNVACHFPLEAT